MLLLIDIGNTNVNLALSDTRGRIGPKYTVSVNKLNLGRVLHKIKVKFKVKKIIIVSVAPKVLIKVKKDLKKNFRDIRTLIVGKNITVPLKCTYKRGEIGQDRLITAFAAKSLYGLPILIIDFGTAVTFDVVSRRGIYLGGLIVPGIKMSLESLSERTAMLPKTYLKKPHSFIAKNTHSSIRNGMIYGYASMCDGLVTLFRKKLGKNLKVIATGGDAQLISRYTKSLTKTKPHLSLTGLSLL